MGDKPQNRGELTSLIGSAEPPAGQAAGLRRFDRAITRSTPHATACDFRWADALRADELRAVASIAESAARPFAAALSGLARTSIEVRVQRIEQTTYAEFVNGLSAATCLCLISSNGIATNLALDCSPTVLYPIIDRLLGGEHEAAPVPDRPLTDIERRLAARVAGLLLDALSRSWQAAADVEFDLARIETNPRVAAVVPPSELTVVVSFELALSAVRGAWQLCMPHRAIEPMRGKLADFARTRASELSPALAGVAGSGRTAELVVSLARLRLPAAELEGLSVGDIITTDRPAQGQLEVAVDGQIRLSARAGAYKGRKAICIEERIEPPAG